MKINACYCTAKGHGFEGACDGQNFPWAKTQKGAQRIMNSWLNSGLTSEQIGIAIGCGWKVSFAKKYSDMLCDVLEKD